MTELQNWSDPMPEVEALVRSARDYVHASEDLRPRVLESARIERGEQRARRLIRQFCLALVLWGLCGTSGLRHSEIALAHQTARSMSATDRIHLRAEAKAADTGDYGSGLVDAFLELREHQAEMLRLAL
jgi:hypothetical protein